MSIAENTKTELHHAQVIEALLRMKKIGFHRNVIEEFKSERKLNKSVCCKIGKAYIGKLVWLSDEEKKFVEEFEKEHDCVVYHIIESNTSFGNLLNVFYVSRNTDEWEMDNDLIESKCQCVYVKNLTDEMCSEFGYINYANALGGLIRTA